MIMLHTHNHDKFRSAVMKTTSEQMHCMMWATIETSEQMHCMMWATIETSEQMQLRQPRQEVQGPFQP